MPSLVAAKGLHWLFEMVTSKAKNIQFQKAKVLAKI